jgi:hypothetical protein
MATVVKDFKVKAGLVVEGANATVGGFDVLKKDNEQDEAYIIGLVSGGGGSSSENTPSTLVLRDENGNFAAGTVTANRVNIGSAGYIEDDGSIEIVNNDGGDVNITGDDVRLQADDDVTLTAGRLGDSGGDVRLETNGGKIRLQSSDVFVGSDSNYPDSDRVATQGYVDQAELDATAEANNYTNTALEDYTTTANLDTTVGGYGYLKAADLPEGYTDADVDAHLVGGDGIEYSAGTISADLGYGLQIDVNGQIEIDDNVVATDQNITDAVSTHSDATSGVHGVTGNVVGTSDVQTLTNKTLGSGNELSADLAAGGFTISGLAEPVNASDAATKGYVDAVAEGLHVHASVVALADSNITLPTAPASVDGVTLSVNDRVLLVGQTSAAENGIYVVINGDLARAADYNTAAEIQAGDFVFVSGGNTYAATGWVQENAVATLGTDPIVWDQFSGAGVFSAGNGLTLTGTEFAIDETVTATKSYVDGEIDAHELVTSGIHGVTGDIVGTTDAQTLESKTLGTGTVLGADLDGTNTYKIVNLVDPTANQDAATKKYVDDEITSVNGVIDNLTTTDIAEGDKLYFTDTRAKTSAANLLTGAALTNITITGDENGLTITAENGVADSTTDDLTEGSNNLYFTDERAQDAIATAIANGTQTNISVTYDDVANSISFVAENGVDDATTDDLDEGASNLYFTDARAVSALEAVVPNFTEIDINDVATQVAASSTGDAAQNVVAYQFATADYRSAKFLVKVAYGTHTELSEVLVTLDTSDNIAITEYAIVGTNGSASAISADVSGGNVRLLVTPTNNSSTIKVMGTLLV